jgi:hypothetical protein
MSRRGFFADLVLGTTRCAVARVTLTDAQIKALPTTPIQLVAAPGSGYRIRLFGVTMRADTVAGAYTNLDATYAAIEVKYAGDGLWLVPAIVDDHSFSPALEELTNFLGTAADQVWDGDNSSIGVDSGGAAGALEYVIGRRIPVANVENKAIQISLDNNGSGALTGGNAANTLDVDVYYAVVAL